MTSPLHIWITGASRGIGASIAAVLTEQGHHVTLSGRNDASLQQISGLLEGGSTAAIVCDVADEASVANAHTAAVDRFGPVDVLINNAGIGVWKDLAHMSTEEFDDQIAINLRGTFLCCRTVIGPMIERRRGMIVTINSIASITNYPGNTAYGASKAGSLALTRSLREEVRDHGVKVCDVIVGATKTDIWHPDAREEFGERMMHSGDVASVVGTLISGFDNPRSHIEEVVVRPQRGDL